MAEVRIYQVPWEKRREFDGYWTGHFPRESYALVWQGNMPDGYTADQAFRDFNRGAGGFIDRMETKGFHFPMHSLSVGDIVAIDGTEYRCERVGWEVVA